MDLFKIQKNKKLITMKKEIIEKTLKDVDINKLFIRSSNTNLGEARAEFGAEDLSGYSSTYVEESDKIISNIYNNTDLLADWEFLDGNNTQTDIPLMDFTPEFQTGGADTPITTSGGTVSFTPRSISVTLVEDRQHINVRKLRQYFPQLKYRGRGAMYDDLEYAKEIIAEKIAAIHEKLEYWALSGATASGDPVNGVLNTAEGESGSLGYYATHSALTTGTAVNDKIIELRKKIPSSVYNMKQNVYLSQEYASLLIEGLADKYPAFLQRGFKFSNDKIERFEHPLYKNLNIIGTHALNDNDGIFITYPKNLWFSGDQINDPGEVYAEANKFHKVFLLDTEFYIGYNYARKEHVVYSKKV